MSPSFDRPSFREIFLSQNKRLEVFFYTSNLDKFLQARLVFERVGLILNHFKSKSDPYSEDYTEGKDRLLARAINEILGSIGHASLFFVEDTSLRIDALSEDERDFPGLGVKEWFARTSFDQLDAELRAKGGSSDRGGQVGHCTSYPRYESAGLLPRQHARRGSRHATGI